MSRNVLSDYFDRVERHLNRLPNIFVEQFNIVILTSARANLKLRVRLQGQYLLAISEALTILNDQVSPMDYRYHFQNEQNEMLFRYDSTPHFPDLTSFPHHKHLPHDVIATDKPSIFQVFQEANNIVEARD